MKFFMACDHAAFDEKEKVKELVESLGHVVEDLGTHSNDRCNYPNYAIKLAKAVQTENAKAFLLCGSGIGVSIVANRFKGVRAALCHSVEDAKLSRQHNDANVLCLGARTTDFEVIKEMVKIWIETEFEGGRHSERLAIFENLGELA